MPKLPTTTSAWVLTVVGIGLFLFSIAMHWQMILVAIGIKHVGSGGGEVITALFGGVPVLVVSSIVLGATSLSAKLRSVLALTLWLLSIGGILAWVVLLITATA